MWRYRLSSLTVKLTGTLVVSLVLLLGITGYIQTYLQRQFSAQCSRINITSLSETLFGALHDGMLANNRGMLERSVKNVTARAPNVRVRIYNKEGVAVYSSLDDERGKRVDQNSEACNKCHSQSGVIEHLKMGDRYRNFERNGVPAIGIIKPIENEPGCVNAPCHAHPANKRLLGVLDVTVNLDAAAQAQQRTIMLMGGTTLLGALMLIGLILYLTKQYVHKPVTDLANTLENIGDGKYEARAKDSPIAEFHYLGGSVNQMASELGRANSALMGWTKTLERRVEEKTGELKQAQQQMLSIERMASLGKLAAIVAHEINNPLSSVVTYAKLLVRRFSKVESDAEVKEILESIAKESARCGDIVSNLLLFARQSGSRFEPTQINKQVTNVAFLLKHKMDMAQVKFSSELDENLPQITCDPAQIEQVFLALMVNGIEAMSEGGEIKVKTYSDDKWVTITIADNGIGMSEEIKNQIFEPFFTTKDEGDQKGLGLGLAVVFGIIQRHHGEVSVESSPGNGSTFKVKLPLKFTAEVTE